MGFCASASMHNIVFPIYTSYVTKNPNKMKPIHNTKVVITPYSFYKPERCHRCLTHPGRFAGRKLKEAEILETCNLPGYV